MQLRSSVSTHNEVYRRTEWLKHIHPEDHTPVASWLASARPDQPLHSIAFRRRRPDGGEVWLEQVAIIQFEAGGKPTRINGLMTDVTERKRFEAELSLARKTAEMADRAKSGFLAAASHDLRQPLQTLKLLQAALEPHHPSGEARNLVTEIGRSLDTMTSILSSLLDVNRLESGNLRPSVSEFSLSEIFEPLAEDFAAPVRERGLKLCIVRSELIIRSDRHMLAEMIRNLLSNAVRYTDRGRILLGCRRAGDNVRIEVWDSGVGIAEDQLPHIFDEYYQGTERRGAGRLWVGPCDREAAGRHPGSQGRGTLDPLAREHGFSLRSRAVNPVSRGRKQRRRCILTMMPSGAAFSRSRTKRPCARRSGDC